MNAFSVVARRLVLWLPIVAALCAAILAWVGYRAVRDADQNARLLAERTAQDAVNLLTDALLRDMRSVQGSVLASYEWGDFSADSPYLVSRVVASAFAGNPYPESFFAWRNTGTKPAIVFWNRADRKPRWADRTSADSGTPVVMLTDPIIAHRLMDRIIVDASKGQNYSVFETELDDVPYQIVASLRYADPYREHLVIVVGFLVNLQWVRAQYFADVTRQLARMVRSDANLTLVVRDEHGDVSASSGVPNQSGIRRSKQFTLSFFDPLSLPPARLEDIGDVRWTAEALIVPNRTVFYESGAAESTVVLAAAATLLLLFGLFLTARAVRESASLAEARSTFVATVTHELKTPVAAIRAAGDTLASGRIGTPEGLRDYGTIVVNEAKRLTRLLDNLLAYARITDVAEVYSFQRLDIQEIISSALRESRSRLEAGGYKVGLEVDPELPTVRGDRTALGLALDNVIDNAIRYSKDNRVIDIKARACGDMITLQIVDHGVGISPDDLPHVTERFFRGENSGSVGSGLGLAIANRVLRDHGGLLRIESTIGKGTTVSLQLPVDARAI